jgi:site-specific DNA-methyltransferase (adenine-specific)
MKFLRTPPDIWEALTKEFKFDVDVCASHENHLCEKYYTKEEDGLKQDWSNQIVYCHPLFDKFIDKWVEKAYNSECLTVMLIPASTHTRYFHRYIYHNPKCEVRFLEKPTRGFRFGADDGTPDDPKSIGYIKPLMVVIFRNMGV